MQLQNHGNGKIIARVCIFFTTTFVIIMAPTMKRKYNSKSILEKYQVLKEIDGGKTAAVVCRERNLSKQTVSNWLKEKAKISVDANIVDKKQQRLKSPPFENIEKALYTWFVNVRHKGTPLSTAVLQDKSLDFAKTTRGR